MKIGQSVWYCKKLKKDTYGEPIEISSHGDARSHAQHGSQNQSDQLLHGVSSLCSHNFGINAGLSYRNFRAL